VTGKLANGAVGQGRMAGPSAIVAAVEASLREDAGDLAGKTVLVSAGPTLEDLDPVRFISNRSSGRMGYALATAARDRGAHVVLVTGPTQLALPETVEVKAVRSALEMQAAMQTEVARADIVVMTAAVADYRPAQAHTHKQKKSAAETLTIELVKNPDILAELGRARTGRSPVLVGFAMETRDIADYGRRKLIDKRVDLIVANEASVGFGGDTNQAILITHDGDEVLDSMTKLELSHRILNRCCLGQLHRKSTGPAPARTSTGSSPDRSITVDGVSPTSSLSKTSSRSGKVVSISRGSTKYSCSTEALVETIGRPRLLVSASVTG
jgi:phosphopantothenoylcysteine decarboxylase/phosphopantothenate--cysteine ligase